MFGLFKTEPFRDADLGELHYKHGFWRGQLSLGAMGRAELIVEGSRTAPNSSALASARKLPAGFDALRPSIAAALFEHLEPYAESEDESGSFEHVESPSDVWAQTKLLFVAVTSEASASKVELGLSVAALPMPDAGFRSSASSISTVSPVSSSI